MEFNKEILKKYWSDPVWSKVISGIILTVGGFIITSLYLIVKSLFQSISIGAAIEQVFSFFNDYTEISNLLLCVIVLVIFWNLFEFSKLAFAKFQKKALKEESQEPKLLRTGETSTSLFSSRLSSAFPGQRGLKWYDAKTAVPRLKILLKQPLEFDPIEKSGAVSDPFWWFRAGQCLAIKHFEVLSKTKILLGTDELEIDRIAVNISNHYYKSFIYIETKKDKHTGLREWSDEQVQNILNIFGYCSEEYALFGKTPISRLDYDDGATVIKGKVVNVEGAKLRVRYLTPYNLFIAAKQSPYNSTEFDNDSENYFNDILNGKKSAEDFFEVLKKYKRNNYD
jgi:hypothetical protein